MSYTNAQLLALEAAIAEGVLKVKYIDKEIEYRSLRQMKEIRDDMRRDLGLVDKQTNRIKIEYNKGL